MEKYILFLWGIILGVLSLQAQPSALFQPLSWEQASLIAARENKLVLIEVGSADIKTEKKISAHRELYHYLQRNVTAIRMDMNSPQGQEFKARLLMYPYPAYAFFMPYADLLEIVMAETVVKDPENLRETLEKAKRQAEVKRRNSRSVHFMDIPFRLALEQADKQEKQIFVEIFREECQPCLLMEKFVYNLDTVADFYTTHFISLRMNAAYAREWVERYDIREFPGYVYLNKEGKLLYAASGKATASQLVAYGEKALEKARGIPFNTFTNEEAISKARLENKGVFLDLYTLGGAHKEMLRTVYADPEVTDLFTDKFINVSREADAAALIFLDVAGEELHRVTQVEDAADLLRETRRVLQGKGVAGMRMAYRNGQRDTAFVREYMQVLARAGRREEASAVAMAYLQGQSPDWLKQQKYWEIFDQYVEVADASFFDYVLTHGQELAGLYGQENVRKKIAALWTAGAENFVHEGVFDELGFKEYARRLKKEKVEGWQRIVRNARMHAAAKTGNWKMYVELAEEKWNEEQISDAELYSWGVLINAECHDEAIRYKAARWFALAADEIARKEKRTGKVYLSSYKGFFEKLVADLLKE